MSEMLDTQVSHCGSTSPTKSKLFDGVLILLIFSVATIEFSVGYGIFSANFATPMMTTRCRDTLNSSAKSNNEKYGPGKMLVYEELTGSESWTDSFENSLKCENSSELCLKNCFCESGYLWSAPVNAKHGFESIHYRLILRQNFLHFQEDKNIYFGVFSQNQLLNFQSDKLQRRNKNPPISHFLVHWVRRRSGDHWLSCRYFRQETGNRDRYLRNVFFHDRPFHKQKFN